MAEEVNELLDSFLALCLEQRQLSSSETTVSSNNDRRREELKASSLELAKKLYTKAAELERNGDISRGTMSIYNSIIIILFFSFSRFSDGTV